MTGRQPVSHRPRPFDWRNNYISSGIKTRKFVIIMSVSQRDTSSMSGNASVLEYLQGISARMDVMLIKVDGMNENMKEISANLERITHNLTGFNLGNNVNLAQVSKG